MSSTPRENTPMPVRDGAPGTAGAGAGPGLRVVLVGRTGLDAALRLDEDVELLRARSALGAIGELSDPIDEHSPHGATVVVAEDVLPPADRAAFLAALRRIEPGVRVLLATPSGRSPAPFDGSIDPDADAATVRRLVRFGFAPQFPQPAHSRADEPVNLDADELVERMLAGDEAEALDKPEPVLAHPARPISRPAPSSPSSQPPPHSPERTAPRAVQTPPPPPPPAPARAPVPVRPPPAAPHVDFGSAVLDAVLTGGDPIDAAVEAIRTRRLAMDARFIPIAEVTDPTRGVPVTYGTRVLGRLVVPGVDPASLAADAAFLAGWIVLRAQQEQLRDAAFTDELTGAWNRRYFNRFLAAAIEQSRSRRHPLTLLAFDIDDFKKYNDKYGHAAGDEILVESVRLLNSVIRPTDRVCRIGGDEFAVIFHDPEGPREPGASGGPSGAGDSGAPKPAASVAGTPSSIAAIAQRFQKQICMHRFPKLADEAPGTLTISGGMASFPWDGRSVQELLERADELARTSKRQGKNVITLGQGAERVCKLGFEQ